MIEIREGNDSITFNVRVIPRSSAAGIAGEYQNAIKVKLNSPPVEGAANSELIKILAKQIGVSKGAISIVSGETSRIKTISIEGDTNELAQALRSLI